MIMNINFISNKGYDEEFTSNEYMINIVFLYKQI